nr:2OG-Fe(II) oxygenase AspE [Aspergillus sp.]
MVAENSLPIVDFAGYNNKDEAKRQKLLEQLDFACRTQGFFLLINHGIPSSVQCAILEQAKDLFDLPEDVKQKYNQDIGRKGGGYEGLNSRGLLNECFYFGTDLDEDEPSSAEKQHGTNKYPTDVQDPRRFREVIDGYYESMNTLSRHLMGIVAQCLKLPQNWFEDEGFCANAGSSLHLIHYPPQPQGKGNSEGFNAHTDWGTLTILLQNQVPGLQVWDRTASQWQTVQPTIPDALIVNLGDLLSCMTNYQYVSNWHRVINANSIPRYSVPFFYSGNLDYIVRTLPTCAERGAVMECPPPEVSTGTASVAQRRGRPGGTVYHFMSGLFWEDEEITKKELEAMKA